MKWFPLFEDKKLSVTHPGSWRLVLDYVPAGTILRIEAEGKWRVTAEGDTCGPDGTLGEPAPLEKYPLGSLIGKLGGSTAGQLEGALFTIGRHCLFKAGDAGGPLYVTMNIASGVVQPVDAYLELKVSAGI